MAILDCYPEKIDLMLPFIVIFLVGGGGAGFQFDTGIWSGEVV